MKMGIEYIPDNSKVVRFSVGGRLYFLVTSGIAKGSCYVLIKKLFRKPKWQPIDTPEEIKEFYPINR